MARVTVRLDMRKLEQLRREPERLLSRLDGPLQGAARQTMARAQVDVPVDSGALRESSFVDGPLRNMGVQLSTTWTAGYEHHAAGAIHQGFHHGVQTQQPPPEWLRNVFRGMRRKVRQGVAKSIQRYLSQNFPKQ